MPRRGHRCMDGSRLFPGIDAPNGRFVFPTTRRAGAPSRTDLRLLRPGRPPTRAPLRPGRHSGHFIPVFQHFVSPASPGVPEAALVPLEPRKPGPGARTHWSGGPGQVERTRAGLSGVFGVFRGPGLGVLLFGGCSGMEPLLHVQTGSSSGSGTPPRHAPIGWSHSGGGAICYNLGGAILRTGQQLAQRNVCQNPSLQGSAYSVTPPGREF